MQGLVAVVTGANRGLGFLVSKKLLEKGAQVVFTARDAKQENLIDQFRKEGLKADFHQLDVTNSDSINKFVQYMEKTYNKCNILCNNAGVYPDEWNESIFKSTMKTNFIGVVDLTLAMLPLIKSTGKGRIVNVTSGYGNLKYQVTEPNLTIDKLINIPYVQDDPMKNDSVPVYKLSKAALNSFSSILAANLKNEGFDNILVNSADPGWCKTDMGGSAAPRPAERGAESIMHCITLEDKGPSGKVFYDGKVQPF